MDRWLLSLKIGWRDTYGPTRMWTNLSVVRCAYFHTHIGDCESSNDLLLNQFLTKVCVKNNNNLKQDDDVKRKQTLRENVINVIKVPLLTNWRTGVKMMNCLKSMSSLLFLSRQFFFCHTQTTPYKEYILLFIYILSVCCVVVVPGAKV